MIKNLLFDLGGVIMNIRRENCVAALTRIGVEGADEMLGDYAQTGEFALLEEGKLTAGEFRTALRQRIKGRVSDAEIDMALNEFLLGIPVHRLELLRRLRKEYKVYLLSNTNPIMFESKISECFRAEGYEIGDYFDGMVLSYEAQLSKPDKAIFIYTAEHLAIDPQETLFFDDSQANIDAAAQCGFSCKLVKPGSDISDYFND